MDVLLKITPAIVETPNEELGLSKNMIGLANCGVVEYFISYLGKLIK